MELPAAELRPQLLRTTLAVVLVALCRVLSLDCCAAEEQKTLPVGDLFAADESLISRNAPEVLRKALQLEDSQRFEYLRDWILPSSSHRTIRMNGVFSATSPSPVTAHQIPVGFSSPVFELLSTAKRLNRLEELLAEVERAAGATASRENTDEQQRCRIALQILILRQLERHQEAAKRTDLLLSLVQMSTPNSVTQVWPETLVIFDQFSQSAENVPGNDLLSFVFAERTQRNIPADSIQWHSLIASLAGRSGHRESHDARKDATADSASSITQWIPASRRRALTRGPGLMKSEWVRRGHRIDKISGHDDDYLFFHAPLTGEYEVECDTTAFTTQALAGGWFFGNDGVTDYLWQGTLRNSASRVKSEFLFSGFNEWIRHRSVVKHNQVTTFLNGLQVHSQVYSGQPDPWFAVRNWWRLHGAAKDVRISGRPVIPESVELVSLPELPGWYPYFEQAVAVPGGSWEFQQDPVEGPCLFARSGAAAGTFCESLLAYQRPLDQQGSVDYEFFYEKGVFEIHPALDRMVFLLHPDGVRIHWLTDGPFDESDLTPDNVYESVEDRRGDLPLPLKNQEWNQLSLKVEQQSVQLTLNGTVVYEGSIEETNDRVFGLFHYADQTSGRVRRVSLRGDWPLALPNPSVPPAETQELADLRPDQLDAERDRLPVILDHDFSRSGLPAEFFTVVQPQPEDRKSVV